MSLSRREFVTALAALSVAPMLPDLLASPAVAATGGPYAFRITFPGNEVWSFSGMVCDAKGEAVDLTSMLFKADELTIRPVGSPTIERRNDAPLVGEYIPDEPVARPMRAEGVHVSVNDVFVGDLQAITPVGPPPDWETLGLLKREPVTLKLHFDSKDS